MSLFNHKKKIGYAFWGFFDLDGYDACKVVETPDGSRFIRSLYIKEMIKTFDVTILQQNRNEKKFKQLKYDDKGFPDLDLLVVEWRWPTWKNDRTHKDHKPDLFEPDWERQLELMNIYEDKCPILVIDTDLKYNRGEFIDSWNCKVVNYAIDNPDHFLFFYNGIRNKKSMYVNRNYVYVGANYERKDSFIKYYYNPSKLLGRKSHVWGNWLNPSPERETPEQILAMYGDAIEFHKRCSCPEHVKIYNESLCCTHIAKDEYYQKGMLTSRFIESCTFGLIAFVPSEFKNAELVYGPEWVVHSSDEVVEKIKFLENKDWHDLDFIVEKQKDTFLRNFPEIRIDRLNQYLERMMKG